MSFSRFYKSKPGLFRHPVGVGGLTLMSFSRFYKSKQGLFRHPVGVGGLKQRNTLTKGGGTGERICRDFQLGSDGCRRVGKSLRGV
jgi:hypothetical protein